MLGSLISEPWDGIPSYKWMADYVKHDPVPAVDHKVIEAQDVALDGIVPAMKRLVAGEIAGKVLVNPRLSASTEGTP